MEMDNVPTEVAQPLPEQMRFSQLQERAAPAIIQERAFTPSNGATFSPDNAREIRIPISVSHGQFVDVRHSFLSVEVEINNAAAVASGKHAMANIDGGVESIVESFSIIGSDGTILERLTNANLIAQAMKTAKYTQGYADNTAMLTEGFSGTQPKDGALYVWPASSAANTKVSQTFTFNLSLSALLNSDRYLPLGFLSGSALSLSLTLAPAAVCLAAHTANADLIAMGLMSYNVKNVQYVASVISYDASTTNLFQSLMSEIGGVQLTSRGVQELGTNSLAASAASGINVTLSLPCRTRSTIAMMHLIRATADSATATNYYISSRRSRRITQYQHSIGGLRYPVAPINVSPSNTAAAMSQIQKSFYTNHDHAAGGIIKRGAIGVDGKVVGSITGEAGTYNFYDFADAGNSFMIMQGFETAPGSSLESGLDLSSQSSNVDLTMTLDTVAASATQINSYVLCDSTFSFLASGIVTVSR